MTTTILCSSLVGQCVQCKVLAKQSFSSCDSLLPLKHTQSFAPPVATLDITSEPPRSPSGDLRLNFPGTMYTNRAPAVLRSSTVSVKQQWGCLQSLLPGNRRQTTTPAAPSPPPPASVVEPVQPTTVVLQAAAEPDIVPLPPPPAPRLPPPTRSFFGELTLAQFTCLYLCC